ncbi:unnamed protein product [Orchesella dallaii]|uniref:Protein quiver n=1 Tax=Orchesella dallaii TaxID=48710 RepID=A0ABP1QCW6_9HEXA
MLQTSKALSTFGILGFVVLTLSFMQIVVSLDCYQCSSFSTITSPRDKDELCENLDIDEELKKDLLKPCVKQKPNSNISIEESEMDTGKIPICMTLEYHVFQEYRFNSGEVEHSKVMKRPSYRRMCAFVKAGVEDKCVSRGGVASRYVQCTCNEAGCNDKPFGSKSYLWIYLLTIFLALAAATGTSCFVYQKTGCNFDK